MSNTCGMGQARKITPTVADIGKDIAMFSMGKCDCKACCRRVVLFEKGQEPQENDDWLVKAFARITFGVQESCIGTDVEVDFKRGVVLDLPGDYVNVNLVIESVKGTPPERLYGAFVTCCSAGAARGVATRTLETVTNAGSGALSLIRVPPFAYAVDFASPANDFYVAGVTVGQSGSGNQLATTLIDLATGADIVTRGLPWRLVGGIEQVLVSKAAAGAISFEPVFYIGV
jgi:hypothetical protein